MEIVGKPALVLIDLQRGGGPTGQTPGIEHMPIAGQVLERVLPLVACCRENDVPVIFIQEVHKPTLVDIGRELDGAEGPHCIEGDPATELAEGLVPAPNEFHIRKRRYSAFFATELELVLKSYGAETLLLVGGLTNVCVHYTAVDAHQHDYHIRVAVDGVIGSSQSAHDAALAAIDYLQSDALTDTAAMIEAVTAYAQTRSDGAVSLV